MAESSPFTHAVLASMRKLYPEALADKSFDNTGLLLEAPYKPHLPRRSNSVLLTIDLTKSVANEAIVGNHSVIVAYHPIIFRGLKSLTLNDTQQASLLKLAAHGISVYCPHTAVDIVPDGMGDWLCDLVTGKANQRSSQSVGQVQPSDQPTPRQTSDQSRYTKPFYISTSNPTTFAADVIPHTRHVIKPSPEASLDAANKLHASSSSSPLSTTAVASSTEHYTKDNTGAGRIIKFSTPQLLNDIINRIATSLNNPQAIQIAVPQHWNSTDNILITTVGLCPGSGSSVLRAANPFPPDLILTGEMSHHEALAVIERGRVVITLNHSNSERGYLNAIMREKLKQEISTQWEGFRTQFLESNKSIFVDDNNGIPKGLQEMLADDSVEVVVSKIDRDPFGIMILRN